MFFPALPGTFLADFHNSVGIELWQKTHASTFWHIVKSNKARPNLRPAAAGRKGTVSDQTPPRNRHRLVRRGFTVCQNRRSRGFRSVAAAIPFKINLSA
jgi:hypothetical protein